MEDEFNELANGLLRDYDIIRTRYKWAFDNTKKGEPLTNLRFLPGFKNEGGEAMLKDYMRLVNDCQSASVEMNKIFKMITSDIL